MNARHRDEAEVVISASLVPFELHESKDVLSEGFQAFAATKRRQVDDEAALYYFAARIFDQMDGSRCRSSRRNEIVDQHHALAWSNCVNVHLDAVRPVFELVIPPHGAP